MLCAASRIGEAYRAKANGYERRGAAFEVAPGIGAAAQMIWRVRDLTVWDDEVLSVGMVGRRKGVQRMK